jgi:hypothetical protein
LKIQNDAGRHAFIGIAFNERNDAFDFNVALQEHKSECDREDKAISDPKTGASSAIPLRDLSIRSGEKITVKIGTAGGVKKDKKPMTPFTPLAPPGSGPKKGLLAPPPSSPGVASNSNPPSFQLAPPQIPKNNNTNVFDNFNANNSNVPKSDPFGNSNIPKSDPFGTSNIPKSDPYGNSNIPKSDTFGMSPSFANPTDPFAIPVAGNKQQMSKSDLLDLFNK